MVLYILVTTYKTIDPFDKGYETQDFFGYQILDIQSDSMYPLLTVGDGALVKIVDDSTEIVEGDIVAYRIGEHIIVHRVKEVVNGNSYITKGDYNAVDDGEPSPRSDIMGKYVRRIPNIHGIMQTMKTPLGIGAAFVLIFSLSKFIEYPSPRSDIMGKYVRRIPNIHGIMQTMKTPLGIGAAFVLIFSLSKFIEYALKYPDIYFRYSEEELTDEDDEEDEEC